MNITGDRMKFLRLLSEKYPTRQQVCTEIINLQAILNLPKGTEHFMSDLHGEYEAFFPHPEQFCRCYPGEGGHGI